MGSFPRQWTWVEVTIQTVEFSTIKILIWLKLWKIYVDSGKVIVDLQKYWKNIYYCWYAKAANHTWATVQSIYGFRARVSTKAGKLVLAGAAA